MSKNKILFRCAVIMTVAVALLLSGCTTPLYNMLNGNVDQTKAEMHHIKNNYETPPPVEVNKGLYVDENPVTVTAKPAWLQERVTVHGRGLPLAFYVSRIMSNANVNVSYLNGIRTNKIISMQYSGTVKGALQKLAAKTGYNFHASGNSLVWSDLIARTFDISFMPGSTQYMVGGETGPGGNSLSGGNSGSGSYFGDPGNSSAQYSNIKANLSVWNDVTKTLNDLKSKQGKVVVSQATTSVTVYDHPQNVAMMAKYLHQLNRTLSRQVALQVRVIEVDLNKSFNYGINWNLVRKGLGGIKLGLTGSLAQPVSMSPLGNNPTPATSGFILKGETGGKWEGTDMLINALKQQGKVSISTEPRVVTLNNQVAEIGINQLQGYLQSVSTTVQGTTAATTETLTPGIVKTGFSLYILPKIKGKNVYLQISSALSRLQNIQNIQASDSKGSNAIQVPTVLEKIFNQRSVVYSGDTLVIAGFKQIKNQTANTKTFNTLTSQGGINDNVETIVLITPTVIG